jgi:hypothetical protein
MVNEVQRSGAHAAGNPATGRKSRRISLVAALVLAPVLGLASPTPPPPAPAVKLGEVKVLEETRGTRTVVDAAGRRHFLMRRVTPADRKAAAARARTMREAAQKRQLEAFHASQAAKARAVPTSKEGTK